MKYMIKVMVEFLNMSLIFLIFILIYCKAIFFVENSTILFGLKFGSDDTNSALMPVLLLIFCD